MSVVLSEHLSLLASAPDGIQKLRGLILELAVRGKLVPQDPNDEPASELLKWIATERARLEAEGVCKKSKPLPQVGEDEQPFAIPNGWLWVRLAGIASFENGDRSKNYPSRDEFVPSGIPFINAGHLLNRRVNFVEMNFIQQVRFDALRAGKTRKGDLLFCLRGSLGKFGVVVDDAPAAIASSLVIIRLYEEELLQYVETYFSSPIIAGQIAKFDNGTAQPNLGAGDLTKFVFPLPPLAEQHRIVAKVDELMALCDRLEAEQADAASADARLVETLLGTLTQSTDAADLAANWQRLAEHFDTLFTTEASIDVLKQTVLQLAVMGKLVPQDPNDEPASELLKRIVQERARLEAEGVCKKSKPLPPVGEDERFFPVPAGWEWVRLGMLSEVITSGSRDWAQHYATDGAIFVRMGNLSRGSYQLRLNNIQHVKAPDDGEGTRTRLQASDLLLSITGEVGLLGLIPEGFGEAYINQHTSLIRTIPIMRGRFIPEVLRTPMATVQFNEPQRGIKNSFRLSDVAELMIPLPPLAEQHRIVAKVDELMALCDRLKADLATARLHQAVLADTLIESALDVA